MNRIPSRWWVAMLPAVSALASLACPLAPCALGGESAPPAVAPEGRPLNAGASGNPYGGWKDGLPADPGFFPIAVWLQSPRNAARYRAAGFNVYVGLWKGPTEEQLAALRAAGMRVICEQNEVGLAHARAAARTRGSAGAPSEAGGSSQGGASSGAIASSDSIIVGWMHGDEPDNAQSLGEGKGYGPPVPPERILADYERIRKADPTRPVVLNLGQGVAWDGWYGRGVRTNHPEDYREYVKGGDIVSFDIYPAVHDKPEVAGNLWFVAKGVDRLRQWTGDRKVVWNCIECTRIGNEKVKPTPHQVRAEVWMSIVRGSMGLIYFVHQFRPEFVEAGLLADREMTEAVTGLNAQIHALAPILNSPTVKDAVTVKSSDEKVPIDVMAKRHEGTTYVFAVSMRDAPAKATFQVKGLGEKAQAEMIGGEATLDVLGGKFEDTFRGYEVRLYRIR